MVTKGKLLNILQSGNALRYTGTVLSFPYQRTPFFAFKSLAEHIDGILHQFSTALVIEDSFNFSSDKISAYLSRPSCNTLRSNVTSGSFNISLPYLADCVVAEPVSLIYFSNSNLFSPRNASINATFRMSEVISISFGTPRTGLSDPLSFLLAVNTSLDATCVFFDYTINEWSSDGCTTTRLGPQISCACTHTTNFAVLTTNHAVSTSALDIIATIGVSISLPCLAIVALTFLCVKTLRTMGRFIITNLALAQIGSLTLFAFGINHTTDTNSCQFIAIFLHYFLLVAFMFMMFDTFFLWRKFSHVHDTSAIRNSPVVYLLAGWGLPALTVVVCYQLWAHMYGSDRLCWLSGNLIYAFLGPVAIVVFLNFMLLVRIFVITATLWSQARKNLRFIKLTRAFFASLAFFPVMGGTWVFGLLTIMESAPSIYFQYIFSVLAGLQGIFIFVFYYLYDRKVVKWIKSVLWHNIVMVRSTTPTTPSIKDSHAVLIAPQVVNKLNQNGTQTTPAGATPSKTSRPPSGQRMEPLSSKISLPGVPSKSSKVGPAPTKHGDRPTPSTSRGSHRGAGEPVSELSASGKGITHFYPRTSTFDRPREEGRGARTKSGLSQPTFAEQELDSYWSSWYATLERPLAVTTETSFADRTPHVSNEMASRLIKPSLFPTQQPQSITHGALPKTSHARHAAIRPGTEFGATHSTNPSPSFVVSYPVRVSVPPPPKKPSFFRSQVPKDELEPEDLSYSADWSDDHPWG